MIIEYVIFGILALIAIVITPLSIRARRKTLKEIDSLRVTFQRDIEELTNRVELKIGKSIDKQQDLIVDRDLDLQLIQKLVWRRYLDFGEHRTSLEEIIKKEEHYGVSYIYTVASPYTDWAKGLTKDTWYDYKVRGRAMLTAPTRREMAT